MDDAPVIERHEAYLDELARLGLRLARDLNDRAIASETDDGAVRLAMAFQHVSRSVRQCLALQARLTRDLVRSRREDLQGQVRIRRDQVKAAVSRAIHAQGDPACAIRLDHGLDERLETEALDVMFLNGPVESHIARLCRAMGLEPPASPPLTTSCSGLSLGPMPTEAEDDPPTAQPHPEPAVFMAPRDKPWGDVRWGGDGGDQHARPQRSRPTPIPWRSSA